MLPRIKEHLRRRIVGIPLAFRAVCVCCAALTVMCAALWTHMRFTFITTSDGTAAAVFAPLDMPTYALQLGGVTFIPEDGLLYTDAQDGSATLYVERAFDITLHADGKVIEEKTVPGTVQDALARFGIKLGEHDYTEPGIHTALTPETGDITVHRVEYVEYEVDEVIPYETEMQYTSLFYRTPKRVLTIQEGKDGYFRGTWRDKLVDGEEVETVALETLEFVEPVTEILKTYREGALISAVEAPEGITVTDNVPSSYSTVYEMKATGYYSARGKGSSGLGLYYGTFAVDPTLIPYGTKVYIVSTNGKFVYGWAIATDTGAFIHSNRMQVDLFYETYTESAANAVQQVYVYVP